MEDLGSRLPYRVVRILGEGSHGVVLHVEHKRLGKPFVLKLIQEKFSANHDVVRRFIAEAQRVARLDHEAFVPIVDLGETDDGRAYFVMEFLAGMTLQQALREHGPYSLEEGVGLGLQLLEGLAVAHEAQIIHRDIKPANLFVTAKGRLKILDFGISKSMIDHGTGPQTAHGIAIGTPRYMSPEQAFGKSISAATDLYAAGLVIFELLAGSVVFEGPDAKAILWAQIHTPAPSLRERTRRYFPDAIEAALARSLRKEPAERFQSAREMASALASALETGRASAAASASPDQTTDERTRPTIRVSNPGAFDPGTGVMTRPISAEALILGAASTSPASVPASALAVDPTGRTEALPVADLAVRSPVVVAVAEASTTGARGRSGLFLATVFVGALSAVLLAIFGVLYLLRKPAHERVATPTELPPSLSQPPPTSSTVASPALSASLAASAAPSLAAVAPTASIAAAPPPTATSVGPAPSGKASAKPKGPYENAVEAMNAGDLDLADSEARLSVAQGGGVPAQLLLAQILERRGKKAAAREIYGKILETNPQMSAAVAGLKRCGG